jgi:acyl-CoA thioester hydrolase
MNHDIAPYLRRAHYYETDQMGIVHHSNYIRWFEEARLDYMKQAGLNYEKIEEDGILMPVTYVNCRYLIPLRFDEVAEIITKMVLFNGVRLSFQYEIYRKDTGKLAVKGESGHCFLDAASRRPLNLQKRRSDLYQLAQIIISVNEGEKPEKD